MSIKNNNIQTVDTDLLAEDEFDPKHVKLRITTMIDGDVLEGVKKIAKDKDRKYQSLINDILRAYVFRQNKGPRLTEAKVRSIVRDELKKKA